MTKIKLCGLSREEDIKAANILMPDFIGFVFAKKSKRFISRDKAIALKKILDPKIFSVGVFVNEKPELIASYLEDKIIDIVQLHGNEDDDYIKTLRKFTSKPIIKAFQIRGKKNLQEAETSTADYILLDYGSGDGKIFDWSLIKNFSRPYFLAGGLNPENVSEAIATLNPFAVDVSSGIESEGFFRRYAKQQQAEGDGTGKCGICFGKRRKKCAGCGEAEKSRGRRSACR